MKNILMAVFLCIALSTTAQSKKPVPPKKPVTKVTPVLKKLYRQP